MTVPRMYMELGRVVSVVMVCAALAGCSWSDERATQRAAADSALADVRDAFSDLKVARGRLDEARRALDEHLNDEEFVDALYFTAVDACAAKLGEEECSRRAATLDVAVADSLKRAVRNAELQVRLSAGLAQEAYERLEAADPDIAMAWRCGEAIRANTDAAVVEFCRQWIASKLAPSTHPVIVPMAPIAVPDAQAERASRQAEMNAWARSENQRLALDRIQRQLQQQNMLEMQGQLGLPTAPSPRRIPGVNCGQMHRGFSC